MNTLMPYPAYKDSAVPWLGRIPAHWGLPRLGALLSERGETNIDGSVVEVLSVLRDRGVIPYVEKGNIGNKKSEDITRYKVVRANDIVVNCMNVIIGSVGISRYTGCLSPVYYVLTRRSEDDDPRYLNACFQTKPFQQSLVRIGNGILAHRMRIPMELLKCELFPRPPLNEQHAITRYLDYIDRRIRRYIRARQKLIALLEEQKQVVIHQAVTGQIDVRTGRPYQAYKPSGVEWLGDVPKHWEVLRSKYLFREIDTRSSNGDEIRLSMSQKFGLIPSTEIEEKRLLSESSVGGKLCERDDLVLNRLKAHLGVFALASQQGIVSPDYTVFRASSETVPRYFEAVYRTPACRVELRQRAKGIVEGFWRLYTNDFYDIRVPVPPVSEQREIMDRLDIELSDLARAVDRTQREIALVREYRTRLIADVVTGKVDVRAAAALLPDESEEIDAPEEMEEITEDEEGDEPQDHDDI